MTKKALIFGITGQDGSYLSELLLGKGYEVHGVIRRSSTINTERIDDIFDPEDRRYLHYGDIEEDPCHLLYQIQPDEIYNLAAMSHVRISFDVPVYTGLVNAIGPLRILEAIRKLKMEKKVKFYQASSSEMYGVTPPPQNEETVFNPVSPYGVAKLYGYHITKTYRKAYNIFASNGILFNHESERRGVRFVTRKITRAAARIKFGIQDKLYLGNLDSLRDWGHARDYMRAIYLIMQHDKPDDFVVSTGYMHTVKDFMVTVFNVLDMDWKKYVVYEKSLERPNEVPALCGDSTKIRETLDWKPVIPFNVIVKLMVDNDLNEIRKNS